MSHIGEINKILTDLDNCITMLYTTTCGVYRNKILNHMRGGIKELHQLNHSQSDKNQAAIASNESERDFTIEELAAFNGKNGIPAYIAINGIVYDVSNIAAWAAGTHFGLSAGKDLSSEYNICHQNQPVIQKLPVVGKLK